MKNLWVTAALSSLLLLAACKEEKEGNQNHASVTTGIVSEIVDNIYVDISSDVYLPSQTYNTLSVGICYSSSCDLPTIQDCQTAISDTDPDGQYKVRIAYLKDSTTYFYRSFVCIDGKSYYGEVLSFSTIFDYSQIVRTGDASVDGAKSVIASNVSLYDFPESDFQYFIHYSMEEENLQSGKDSIAICSVKNDSIFATLKDLTKGTYYYRACVRNITNEDIYYGEVKNFTIQSLKGLAVDLGLSVKWAACNIGAGEAEGFGDPFAWGETTTKDRFEESNYKYYNGSFGDVTKYCDNSIYGPVDSITVLEPNDDAATANWGDNWRMPTSEEIKEICNQCTWAWTAINGINGNIVIGPNGNYIFIPVYPSNGGTGSSGGFWGSTLYPDMPSSAHILSFTKNRPRLTGCGRSYKMYVRAVCPK